MRNYLIKGHAIIHSAVPRPPSGPPFILEKGKEHNVDHVREPEA